jgi:hypothetical protein
MTGAAAVRDRRPKPIERLETSLLRARDRFVASEFHIDDSEPSLRSHYETLDVMFLRDRYEFIHHAADKPIPN